MCRARWQHLWVYKWSLADSLPKSPERAPDLFAHAAEWLRLRRDHYIKYHFCSSSAAESHAGGRRGAARLASPRLGSSPATVYFFCVSICTAGTALRLITRAKHVTGEGEVLDPAHQRRRSAVNLQEWRQRPPIETQLHIIKINELPGLNALPFFKRLRKSC